MSPSYRSSIKSKRSIRVGFFDGILRLFLAALMALLMGIVVAIAAGKSNYQLFFTVFTVAGLVIFGIILFRTLRVGFWFSFLFAIEWALFPVAILLGSSDYYLPGFSGWGISLSYSVLLAITIPLGVTFFLFFLILGMKFRK
ncbi:MAG: hypothetical protein NTV30_02020 [Chloroflexi bacterium]|nr:hypothetical protein [Chloroflexota bacterium]